MPPTGTGCKAIYLPLIQRWLGRVPGPRRRVGRPGPGGAHRRVPRGPAVRPAARGIVPGLASAGDREQDPELPQEASTAGPPSGSIRPTGFSNACPTRMTTSPASGTGITTSTSFKSCWRSCNPTSARRPGQAFQRFGVDGVPAGRVAEELGLSENAVILAKSRVLKRLREEAGDLLE